MLAVSDFPAAVTIGFFDGVHLGHQELCRRCLDAAARLSARPVAVTFDLHRFEVLGHAGPVPTLSTTEEKAELLVRQGLIEVRVLHFTAEFAAQSGHDFARTVLHEALHARHVVVGHDFRFGHRRHCGVAELAAFGQEFDFTVDAVQPVLAAGERISSKAIRGHLLAGEVEAAATLLGRPYCLSGEVVRGRQLGRTLGFPTANVACDPRKILPALGVYAARVTAHGTSYPAVLNLGRRPTVEQAGAVTLEAHLLDFTGDLYGERLAVDLMARLRGEQTFAGLDALRAQIALDSAAARRVLTG